MTKTKFLITFSLVVSLGAILFISLFILSGTIVAQEGQKCGDALLACQDGYYCDFGDEQVGGNREGVCRPVTSSPSSNPNHYNLRNMTATAISDSRIDVSWTWYCSNPDTQGGCVVPFFEVLRDGISRGYVYRETSYSNTGLNACTLYNYKVNLRDWEGGNILATSNLVEAKTDGCQPYPEPKNTLRVRSVNPDRVYIEGSGNMSGITAYDKEVTGPINTTLTASREVTVGSKVHQFEKWEASGQSCNAEINNHINQRTAKVSISGGNTCTITANYVTPPDDPGFNFSLSNDGNKSVVQGGSVNSLITTTVTEGTPQSVTHTVSGLPSGATAVPSSWSCTPDSSCSQTIQIIADAPVGDYTVTVTGTRGSTIRTTSFNLKITSTPTPPNAVLNVQSVGATGVSITGSTTWLRGTTNYTVTRTSNFSGFLGADLDHDGKKFNKWEGCHNTSGTQGQGNNATGNICQTGPVNLGDSKTVTAYYVDPPVTQPINELNVETCGVSANITATVPAFGGTTTYSRTAFTTINPGSLVAPSAISGGWSFDKWEGCDSSSGTSCNVVISGGNKKTVRPCYIKDPAKLTVRARNTSNNSVINAVITATVPFFGGTTDYEKVSNASINTSLTANAVPGYSFSNWSRSGNCGGSGATVSISLGNSCTMTANYNPLPATLEVRSNNPSAGVRIVRRSGTSGTAGTTEYNFQSSNISTQIEAPREAPDGNIFSGWSGCDTTEGPDNRRYCNVSVSAGNTPFMQSLSGSPDESEKYDNPPPTHLDSLTFRIFIVS